MQRCARGHTAPEASSADQCPQLQCLGRGQGAPSGWQGPSVQDGGRCPRGGLSLELRSPWPLSMAPVRGTCAGNSLLRASLWDCLTSGDPVLRQAWVRLPGGPISRRTEPQTAVQVAPPPDAQCGVSPSLGEAGGKPDPTPSSSTQRLPGVVHLREVTTLPAELAAGAPQLQMLSGREGSPGQTALLTQQERPGKHRHCPACASTLSWVRWLLG